MTSITTKVTDSSTMTHHDYDDVMNKNGGGGGGNPDGNHPLCILDWNEVKAHETTEHVLRTLEQALGPGGVGLVAIRNVPDFVPAKRQFLPQAHALAHLPTDYLEDKLSDAASLYNAGWSHGKEQLAPNRPDWAKACFYYNPLTDTPGTEEDRNQFPVSYPPNRWPDETEQPTLPNFRNHAKELGTILTQVTIELSKHIDALAQQKDSNYPRHFLYHALKDTEKAKARLLYYFPLDPNNNNKEEEEGTETVKEDSWIGWHNDSGFLTALAGDLYVDHATGQPLSTTTTAVDPLAGLYVLGRNGVCQRMELPSDCVAVQIGECTQIVTGGAVVATPHCVRGAAVPPPSPPPPQQQPHSNHDGAGADDGTTTTTTASPFQQVARISLPCFVDTPPTFPLSAPAGSSRQQVLDASLTSRRVPPLEDRWTENGMTFGAFLQKSFEVYYNWNNDNNNKNNNNNKSSS